MAHHTLHHVLASRLGPCTMLIAGQGFAALALAQSASPPEASASEPASLLPRVTVTAPAPATAGIAGWGDQPLKSLPLQATVIDRAQIDDAGARRLADLLKLDASATDAYNSPGYWDYLAVRGYTLDPRFNFRREGLPISAETAIPLENKDRLEILKGTSGIQAGTSAPGGLVNYVVKRPTGKPLASATLAAGERGSLGVAVDWSGGKRDDGVFAHRLLAASEDRQPVIDHYGHLKRGVLAWAGDWQLAAGTLLQVEMESSRQIGASLPAYSLTGNTLPTPRSPANLGDLPWALPNTFGALTGSIKLDHKLAGPWRWTTLLGAQRLKTDDRLPFAFGCFDAGANVYYDNRYCPNGNFDIYDFRSDDERRRTDAAETALQGKLQTGALQHDLRLGMQASRQRIDVNRQAFNPVGTGNIDGSLSASPDPGLTDEGTNRRERSTEVFALDAIDWGSSGITTWLGLRHTRLHRASVRTDGGRATSYPQSITTPSVAWSYGFMPQYRLYTSWGQGAESAVVPGRPDRYTNAGEPLPALKSRQLELGVRHDATPARWSLALFDIRRPEANDFRTDDGAPATAGCSPADPCTRRIDGRSRHRGLDASGGIDRGPISLAASAMWLHARREASSDASLNGQRPVNVPGYTARVQARWRMSGLYGLELAADLSHEGRRNVVEDGSITLPSWTRTDLAAKWQQTTQGFGELTWRFGIDNLLDRRAWKESPKQFGHYYLYPMEARTLRLSLQATL